MTNKIPIIIILLVLTSCAAKQIQEDILCRPPYYEHAEGRCCLDENKNRICDTGEAKETGLITKPLTQMALSSDLGYALNKEDSGMLDPEEEILFKNTSLDAEAFKLELTTDTAEKQATLFLFRFNSTKDAIDGFSRLTQNTAKSAWFRQYPVSNSNADELKAYTKTAHWGHNFRFEEYTSYAVHFRIKNIAATLYLIGKTTDQEINKYITKLAERIKDPNKTTEEMPQAKKAKEYTFDKKLDIIIAGTKKTQTMQAVGSSPNMFLPDYSNTPYQYLTIQMILTNLDVRDSFRFTEQKGFFTGAYSYLLLDEKGNAFKPLFESKFLPSYNPQDILKKGARTKQTIIIPVLKSSREFILEAYDQEGNRVGKTKF